MKAAIQVSTESRSGLEAAYFKVATRIMPLLVLLFVMAWLDRVNVGFAKLQMATDLGFSEAVYGFGAGIFYLGYLLFEIPSNLLLQKIGARKTIARIAILWGLAGVAMILVRSAASFYVLRFLLGVFEAGLYPGVILYLTYWFSAKYRARMLGLFMLAIPVSGIVGGPISGWIMARIAGGAGLANWQWLFLLEGLPSILIGVLTLALLTDKPGSAPWLTTRERQLVTADLETDDRAGRPREHGFVAALKSPPVWLLTLVYFCLVSANPTFGFWLPTIIEGLGVQSRTTIGLLSAIPYIAAGIAIVAVSRHSDRTQERRYHCALSCLAAALGLVFIGLFGGIPVLGFIALVIGVAGVLAAFAPFWQMPAALLTGTAAAGGIALINSIGNLSGWLAPFAVGWLKDLTGTTAAGLYAVAGLEVLAAILVLRVPSKSKG